MRLWQISILFLLILLTSCIVERSNCCKECANAALQDPSGYDVFMKECSHYKLSERCRSYFEENQTVVSVCREAIK